MSEHHDIHPPAYSVGTSNQAIGQIYTLHSVDGVFTISLFAPSSGDVPKYTSGDDVCGRVTWNVGVKEEKLENLSISLRGVSRVSVQEEHIVKQDTFQLINEKQLLWQGDKTSDVYPLAKAGRLLPGTYDFPFAFHFPATYQVGDQDRPLPPTYSTIVSGAPQRIQYFLEVEVERAGTHWHKILSKNKMSLVYVPTAPILEPRTSLAFRKALEAGEFPVLPEIDPENWISESKEIKLKKALHSEILEFEIALSKDRPFRIGSSLPFILSIRIPSTYHDIFKSLRIYLGRKVTTHIRTTVTVMPRSSFTTVTPAIIEQVGGDLSEVEMSDISNGNEIDRYKGNIRKTILGKIHLAKEDGKMCASFETPNMKCQWVISVAFDVPGLSGILAKDHVNFPIELVEARDQHADNRNE